MKEKRSYPQPNMVMSKQLRIALSTDEAKNIIGQLDNLSIGDRLLAAKELIGSDCVIVLYINHENKISIMSAKLFTPANHQEE